MRRLLVLAASLAIGLLMVRGFGWLHLDVLHDEQQHTALGLADALLWVQYDHALFGAAGWIAASALALRALHRSELFADLSHHTLGERGLLLALSVALMAPAALAWSVATVAGSRCELGLPLLDREQARQDVERVQLVENLTRAVRDLRRAEARIRELDRAPRFDGRRADATYRPLGGARTLQQLGAESALRAVNDPASVNQIRAWAAATPRD